MKKLIIRSFGVLCLIPFLLTLFLAVWSSHIFSNFWLESLLFALMGLVFLLVSREGKENLPEKALGQAVGFIYALLVKLWLKSRKTASRPDTSNKEQVKESPKSCPKYPAYGSKENPVVVGMPEYSDHLVYDEEHQRWILTDGLGNGWIR